MAGETFDLMDDGAILSINSPQSHVSGGPYNVVYKDIGDRWVIVAIDWDDTPRLAIRWFWDSMGNPVSRAHPTWFVIPDTLAPPILNGLPLSLKFRKKIEHYLITGKIEGK
jgi:hypothetical protein